MAKAEPVLNYRRDLPNGDVIMVVVWLLPAPLPGSHHRFKYRLHYNNGQGSASLRFDNERGKGDHRHDDDLESPYLFTTLKQLILDFYAAIKEKRRQGGAR